MENPLNTILGKIRDRIDHQEYLRWFKPVELSLDTAEKLLLVKVPNIFFKTWITEHYLAEITNIAAQAEGGPFAVAIGLGDGPPPPERPAPPPEPMELAEPAPPERPGSGLNDKYTFSNFIVGNSNQLAHAASQAVASRTAVYNPLFIYGGSGLGKTHLLNAIGNYMLAQNPRLNVVYLSSEKFTNEFIDALRTDSIGQFHRRYRNTDALLIDDIHFLGGRERTQEEFFFTFNTLYEADKQIVISSDKIPKHIPDLEDRLRSRFEGGLFADIVPPDQETKVAILEKKAEEENISLDTEVAFYLASHHESNIRVLEGYLSRLGAYSALYKRPITMEMAQELLDQLIESDKRQISIDQILKVAGSYFNVKVSDLKSSKKQQAIAMPRQVAMSLARKLTSLSTIEIGQHIGGRDHSTVIHACKKVKNRMKDDKDFARNLYDLEQAIRSSAERL